VCPILAEKIGVWFANDWYGATPHKNLAIPPITLTALPGCSRSAADPEAPQTQATPRPQARHPASKYHAPPNTRAQHLLAQTWQDTKTYGNRQYREVGFGQLLWDRAIHLSDNRTRGANSPYWSMFSQIHQLGSEDVVKRKRNSISRYVLEWSLPAVQNATNT